ncbi:MAG: diaminopimelate epimerase [Gammaproteobacteria bacterium]|nr:diaminopimelate epimerase [Gammaproteobacteria bacterium]MDE0252176.1 diaminopimelate epimerase [Gammaproteobacteria bacterium]MDE0402715.1 diaminopimelate epimerase [Gammaproteobacteria bacterium]MDE0646195.1 diaminopimelate epimerase [Gammaproteobacteria bacterium]
MTDISCPYTKMEVNGNDFVVVEANDCKRSLTREEIQLIGNRRFGVGFDQLLIYEEIAESPNTLKLTIFNDDGSEASQCGNGCIAISQLYLNHIDKRVEQLQIISASGSVTARPSDSKNQNISIEFPPPVLKPGPSEYSRFTEYRHKTFDRHYPAIDSMIVSIGNLHVVLITEHVDALDVERIGEEIQADPKFPDSVNVEFLECKSDSLGYLLVYERGVSDLTYACGTGAVAAMAAGKRNGFFCNSVEMRMVGGSVQVDWEGSDKPIYLTAVARTTHEGRFFL